VIVTEGWLDSLIGAVCSAPDIGMAAPMSNHGPASLLVDPVSYGLEMGKADFGGRRGNAQIENLNAFAKESRTRNKGGRFEAQTLGGACVLLKREVSQKLGGFPHPNPFGNFRHGNSKPPGTSGRLSIGDLQGRFCSRFRKSDRPSMRTPCSGSFFSLIHFFFST
jgi:hypothetical protein